MAFIREIFNRDITKRLLTFAVLVFFLYLMKDFLNIILLTFLFTYIMYSLQGFLLRNIRRLVKFNETVLTIILYCMFFILIALIINKYIPIIINQTVAIIEQFKDFKADDIPPELQKYLMPILKEVDYKQYTKEGVTYLFGFASHIGKISFNVSFSLILSMFFMLEKYKIKAFVRKFGTSRISGAYKYLEHFARNFMNSFGKVMQAQILIALCNSALSMAALGIMGFKQLLGLGVMIFIFSLVPVAGTVASLIPLSVIAFNIGGTMKVIYVLVMVGVLHALESYVLNPKFMSAKTDLPVFFVFIILAVSEHFMGVWGLLIGIPLFIFILDLLNVKFVDEKPNEKTNNNKLINAE